MLLYLIDFYFYKSFFVVYFLWTPSLETRAPSTPINVPTRSDDARTHKTRPLLPPNNQIPEKKGGRERNLVELPPSLPPPSKTLFNIETF